MNLTDSIQKSGTWLNRCNELVDSIELKADAIHSEVRVPYFSLCNGFEFVLYHISQVEPVLHCPIIDLGNCWEALMKLLSPSNVLDYDFKLAKDFGLRLKRLGFSEFSHLCFLDIPVMFIARIEEDKYTFGSGVTLDNGDKYTASFDFGSDTLNQLLGKVPEDAIKVLSEPYDGSIHKIEFVDRTYMLSVDCQVGEQLEENEKEIWLPIWVNRFVG